MLRQPGVVTLTILLLLSSAAGAPPPERDFAGTWILEPPAEGRRALPAPPYRTLKVSQQDAAIHCAATNENGAAARWSYRLDGNESRDAIGAEVHNSVVKWEGDALLVNTLVSGSQNYTIMDRWRLSRDRATLTITRQVVLRSGEVEAQLTYHKEGQLTVRPAPAAPAPVPVSAAPPVKTSEPPPAPKVTVPAGTRLVLALRNPLDTRHSHEGDPVYLTTAVPVTAGGRVVIPRGSTVNGVVTQSKSAHGVAGKGELFLRFDVLILPNGVTRDFRSRPASADSTARGRVDSKEGKITGERDSSGDARSVALGTGVGASVGGIAGAAAGHPMGGVGIGAAAGAAAGLASVLHRKRPEAVLPRGTTLEMVLDRDLRFAPEEIRF
jgi:type IV secretion system protein VirB10